MVIRFQGPSPSSSSVPAGDLARGPRSVPHGANWPGLPDSESGDQPQAVGPRPCRNLWHNRLPVPSVEGVPDAESEHGDAEDDERRGGDSVVVAQAVAMGRAGAAVVVRCPLHKTAA